MPSYLVISESKITLLGPLFSSEQEDTVLKTFSSISEIFETPILPLGFTTNFHSYNNERMECSNPFIFVDKAVAKLEDLKEVVNNMVNREKISKKQLEKLKKMHGEFIVEADIIKENINEVIDLRLETLKKVKSIFQQVGLQE
jgi:uncharacterized alpha/beta hydrolase family protein